MRHNVVRAMCAVALTSAALVGCTVKVSTRKDPPKPKVEPKAAPAPAPAPAPEPQPEPPKKPLRRFNFKVADNRVQLPGPVLFETGTAKLLPESSAVLEIVAAYLEQNPKITKHRIEGHTDTDNDDASNQRLSEARAMAVTQWLVAKGIDCKRLVPVGFGESKLKVSPEKTAEDKAANRRVEFVNAELDGKAIGGLPLDGGGKIAGDACR